MHTSGRGIISRKKYSNRFCVETIERRLYLAAPANDNFANRQMLSGDDVTINGSNVGATAEFDEPAHLGLGAGPSIWYSWTPTTDGGCNIYTTDSQCATGVVVYTGSNLTTLVYRGAGTNETGTFWSHVRFACKKGITYQIAVTSPDNTPLPPTGAIKLHLIYNTGGTTDIQGRIYNDTNSNGTKDASESYIVGAVAYADLNNNNTKEANEPSATTDSGGLYIIKDLAAGTYYVKQILQSGYRKTQPGSGSPGYVGTLGDDQMGINYNFGVTKNIYIGGYTYLDANGNGFPDGDEFLLTDVTVNIIANGTTVASRTTTETGIWQVKGLGAGTGTAQVVVPEGYVVTQPAGGKYTGTMSSGQQNGSLHFGLKQIAPSPAPATAAVGATAILDSRFYRGFDDPTSDLA